jgi:hypothetical protein
VIVVLYWFYSSRSRDPKEKVSSLTMICVSSSLIALAYLCFMLPNEKIPGCEITYLGLLPLANTPILLGSRIPQIYKNYIDNSTGTLSLVSTLLTCVGSMVRVFTTITDVGLEKGMSMIINSSLGSAASGIILLQVRLHL